MNAPMIGATSKAVCPRGLSALGLSDDQLTALARQGFVAAEYRGQRGATFKLRFRFQGRQVVRYLGQDPAAARQIREAVLALQAERRDDREMQQAIREARNLLRETKRQLLPDVRREGFKFHGFAIRRVVKQQSQSPSVA